MFKLGAYAVYEVKLKGCTLRRNTLQIIQTNLIRNKMPSRITAGVGNHLLITLAIKLSIFSHTCHYT